MITRLHPQFSLCGLNCALCPRYNATGRSRCLGCGAKDFSDFHPTCAIMTCNNKKENVDFCFDCSHYPCKKYAGADDKDSFISYARRKKDMISAQHDLKDYLAVLAEKSEFLGYLLEHHNDGRSKNFYCVAVNLLDIEDLRHIRSNHMKTTGAENVREIILETAKKRGVSIVLRK